MKVVIIKAETKHLKIQKELVKKWLIYWLFKYTVITIYRRK
jgi:hypothetical protein